MRRRHKFLRLKKAEIKKLGVSSLWPNMFGKGTGLEEEMKIVSRKDGQIYEVQKNGSIRKKGTLKEEQERKIILPSEEKRIIQPAPNFNPKKLD